MMASSPSNSTQPESPPQKPNRQAWYRPTLSPEHGVYMMMEQRAWGKNYAGLLPIYDVIFGTFYVPPEQPKVFGIYSEKMTENFVGQMLYPFRNLKFLQRLINN